jgi:DNA-binding XRE family transcriptional regulator
MVGQRLTSDVQSEIADTLEQCVQKLRQQPPQQGWIFEFRAGAVLTTSQAADVADVSAQTIRTWCEASDETERPLGFLIADLWLVDLGELLHQIELRRGRHDRLAAESRAKKYAPIWPRPEIPVPNLAATKC